MMRSRANKPRLVLLNKAGQRRLEGAFESRSRPRASFPDFAEGYVRALEQEGVLLKYLRKDVDPFEVLEWVAERGLRSH